MAPTEIPTSQGHWKMNSYSFQARMERERRFLESVPTPSARQSFTSEGLLADAIALEPDEHLPAGLPTSFSSSSTAVTSPSISSSTLDEESPWSSSQSVLGKRSSRDYGADELYRRRLSHTRSELRPSFGHEDAVICDAPSMDVTIDSEPQPQPRFRARISTPHVSTPFQQQDSIARISIRPSHLPASCALNHTKYPSPPFANPSDPTGWSPFLPTASADDPHKRREDASIISDTLSMLANVWYFIDNARQSAELQPDIKWRAKSHQLISDVVTLFRSETAQLSLCIRVAVCDPPIQSHQDKAVKDSLQLAWRMVVLTRNQAKSILEESERRRMQELVEEVIEQLAKKKPVVTAVRLPTPWEAMLPVKWGEYWEPAEESDGVFWAGGMREWTPLGYLGGSKRCMDLGKGRGWGRVRCLGNGRKREWDVTRNWKRRH
ncbi:hypothetical protein K402DRAFT_183387 [Aulographum hederae CBS 113979]|uniref:Uncharacterized protein n=1 Tax=Aulographum hederae CBS 113979 TaxID=1176131 RepID=A0A6G1GPQ2_9PEZI|nr:hypothetical protein K402DRAFT_183387 [Aulographum hederae CBS 113979]